MLETFDAFVIGTDRAMYHKAWDNGWTGWESLGGIFSSSPVATSWGPGRLDIFALGKDYGLWHKAWKQQWVPSQTAWEPLGGGFV